MTSIQGEKTIQTVPTGAKPAILTATRPITKMIVTQPKGIGSTVQPAAKIIPTKIVYGQQGKTQVCCKIWWFFLALRYFQFLKFPGRNLKEKISNL